MEGIVAVGPSVNLNLSSALHKWVRARNWSPGLSHTCKKTAHIPVQSSCQSQDDFLSLSSEVHL